MATTKSTCSQFVGVRVPNPLHARLTAASDALEAPLSELINQLLGRGIDGVEAAIAILEKEKKSKRPS